MKEKSQVKRWPLFVLVGIALAAQGTGSTAYYLIRAPKAGSYTLTVSAASASPGTQLQLIADSGSPQTANVPNSGDWNKFVTVPVTHI